MNWDIHWLIKDWINQRIFIQQSGNMPLKVSCREDGNHGMMGDEGSCLILGERYLSPSIQYITHVGGANAIIIYHRVVYYETPINRSWLSCVTIFNFITCLYIYIYIYLSIWLQNKEEINVSFFVLSYLLDRRTQFQL